MMLNGKIKKLLIDYYNLNADMLFVIRDIDAYFRPLVEEAYKDKDVMKLLNIKQHLPSCDLEDEIHIKIEELLKK